MARSCGDDERAAIGLAMLTTAITSDVQLLFDAI